MTDPRLAVIYQRFEKVKEIIAVGSGKGGVGKSMIATGMALALRDMGYRVGLLDLDFTSPSTHVILGVEGLYPKEEKGIEPPVAFDMKYMSITYYSVDEPTPLRGEDVSNAIIELLSITRWEQLDYLIIDMPPGIGDATLDMIRFIEDLNFLLVTTPSKVAFETVRKLYNLLKDLDVEILGLIENMVIEEKGYVEQEAEFLGLEYLGKIDYDTNLEEAIGDPEKIVETQFFKEMNEITKLEILEH
jgi:ATP-binding protein involved in chromosome partitioning